MCLFTIGSRICWHCPAASWLVGARAVVEPSDLKSTLCCVPAQLCRRLRPDAVWKLHLSPVSRLSRCGLLSVCRRAE